MTPHQRRCAPAVDFPPSPTPRVHHTSVPDSPVPPVPVHELSKIFSAINLQSTTEDKLTNKLDLRSPLKFRQRPGPHKNGVAKAPRWIPPSAATPSRAKCSRTVEFKLRVLAWAHHTRVTPTAGKQRAPTREETRRKFVNPPEPSVLASNPQAKKGRGRGNPKKGRGSGKAATASSASAAASSDIRRSARLTAKPTQRYVLQFSQITDTEESDEDDGIEYDFRWQDGDL